MDKIFFNNIIREYETKIKNLKNSISYKINRLITKPFGGNKEIEIKSHLFNNSNL